MEGVVAKPMINLTCQNKYDEDVRTIVKLKNPGFTEINAKPDVKQQKNKGKKKVKRKSLYHTGFRTKIILIP